MNERCNAHGSSLKLPYANEAKILTQYGLSSHKRPPPLKQPAVLTFWVVANNNVYNNLL